MEPRRIYVIFWYLKEIWSTNLRSLFLFFLPYNRKANNKIKSRGCWSGSTVGRHLPDLWPTWVYPWYLICLLKMIPDHIVRSSNLWAPLHIAQNSNQKWIQNENKRSIYKTNAYLNPKVFIDAYLNFINNLNSLIFRFWEKGFGLCLNWFELDFFNIICVYFYKSFTVAFL